MTKVFISQGSRDFSQELNDTLDRWAARHDADISEPVTGSDLARMTDIEFAAFIRETEQSNLYNLRTELIKIIVDIKGQLTRGRYGIRDQRWAKSAIMVKQKCGSFAEAINLENSRRNKFNTKGKNQYPKYFMDAAEILLTDEQFEAIKIEARRLMQEDIDK